MIIWSKPSYSNQIKVYYNNQINDCGDNPVVYGLLKAPIYTVRKLIKAVECFFKGMANILGCPFVRTFKLSTGFSLLYQSITSLVRGVISFPLMPVNAVIYAARKNYSNNQGPMFTFTEE